MPNLHLAWRAAMRDAQFVAWGAADDDIWYQNVERDFGLAVRRPDAWLGE
jgi:hypothetical protein